MDESKTGPVKVDVQRVKVNRAGTMDQLQTELEVARRLANLFDSQFQVGPVKFGLDALVGLVPVAGDMVSLGAGLYPIYIARKHGLGKSVIARMMGNLAADFGIGIIPVIGDATDIFFKSHKRNLKLLEKAVEKKLKKA